MSNSYSLLSQVEEDPDVEDSRGEGNSIGNVAADLFNSRSFL